MRVSLLTALFQLLGFLQLKKKHSKLLEKYSKLEELKNKFRDCTALVQQKYDVIEKENESLKKGQFWRFPYLLFQIFLHFRMQLCQGYE